MSYNPIHPLQKNPTQNQPQTKLKLSNLNFFMRDFAEAAHKHLTICL